MFGERTWEKIFKEDKENLKRFQNKGERESSMYNQSIGVVTKIVNLTFVIQICKSVF